MLCMLAWHLTELSAIFEPSNPEIDELYVVQKHRLTDFEAPKLGILRSGREMDYVFGIVGSFSAMAEGISFFHLVKERDMIHPDLFISRAASRVIDFF